MNGPPSMQRPAVGPPSGLLGLALVGRFWCCFSNISEKFSLSADSHLGKKNEMWRAGESSVSFKTSVLGRRRRGEQPKVLTQRAGRAECSLLAQESYFICFKLDQIYRRFKK